MSRLSRCVAAVVLAALVAPSAAGARTHQKNASSFASAPAGLSDVDIRRQCFAEAQQRYPSTNQDVQTNRVYTYTTCATEHGVRP